MPLNEEQKKLVVEAVEEIAHDAEMIEWVFTAEENRERTDAENMRSLSGYITLIEGCLHSLKQLLQHD